jgi:Tfp pilus assembly pilus retraction ATPase PilT
VPQDRRWPRRFAQVLPINSAISNLIREAKTFQIPSMMQVGRAQGMVSLNDVDGPGDENW